MPDEGPLPPHGGYRDLRAFQNTVIIHDATVAFCRRFFRPTDRTTEQMVQAARSGKQNIAEGSSAGGTSRGNELRLLGVARASLEELLVDYLDYLRQHDLQLWPKDHEKAAFIRRLAYLEGKSYATYRTYVEDKTSETAANTIICVITQTCFLLDRLKRELARNLVEQGDMRERISQQRKKRKQN